MKRTSARLSTLVAAAALGSLTACGSSGGPSNGAASTVPPQPTTTASSAPSPAGAASTTATGGCPTGAPTTSPSPVTDARATRDALLGAACTAPYDGQSSADLVISKQWQKVAPGLQPGLFADSAATPTTIASSGGFQLDYGHTMDQFFAFAVTDGTTCAGGVAVIPQASSGRASDTRKPTTFAAVDVPAGQPCDAGTVQNDYRPGSVHP